VEIIKIWPTFFSAVDITALACGSLFNFTDSNLVRARSFLLNKGIALKVV
jgi:cyclase